VTVRRPRLTTMRIALILGVAFSILRFNGCATLQRLDTRVVDLRLLERGPTPASDEVVIVAIDDASLETVGRWPWPRSTVAALLDGLTRAEPAVIGFDVVQSEASATRPIRLLQQPAGIDEEAWSRVRAMLAQTSDDDALLAGAVKASGRVVLGYFFDFDRPMLDREPQSITTYNVVQQAADGAGQRYLRNARDAVTNLPALTEAATATGYFNVFPDSGDGLFRRVPVVLRYGDSFALPLSLAMVQRYWDDAPAMLRLAEYGAQSIQLGPRTIPVSENGDLLLNYRGPRRTFRHVAAADVLAGRIPVDVLRGKLVLVGVTATAVADVRATPFDGVLPGVEIHATAIDNVLSGQFLRQPKWTVLVEIAAMLLASLALGLGLRYARGALGALVAVLLGAVYVVGTQLLFESSGIPLGLLFPLVTIAAVYSAISLEHFSVERAEKRRTREAFGLYLNPELARLVSERPELLKLGGDKRVLTVLFSDIRGFTSISEGLEPERLVELLNSYLGEMTDIVFDHQGTLDKYVGDAIMAVWGAPIAHADHARRSCLAAIDMVERLEALRAVWCERGWPALDIGIGVHTGEVVVGNMGSAKRLSYTAIGDNVNVASRLEGLTKLYGVRIIASESTLGDAGSSVVARELDLVQVKGKARPVRIYEIMGRSDERAELATVCERFAEGLAAYRARHWRDAEQAFREVDAMCGGDGPSRLYLYRCEQFAARPPASDWRGVAVMDTK